MSSANIFLILFFSLVSANVQSETILMKGDQWCPFNCEPTGAGSKENGYMVEVARIIFERNGHNVVYQIDTWSNSIKSVKKGDATALLATTKADAPELIYPDKIMGANKECFYVKAKDKWEFIGVDTLKKRKLGTAESYAYSGELTAFMVENPSQLVKATGSSPLDVHLENLNKGKIDTIVENPFVFNYYTEKKKVRDQYEDAGCTTGDDLYIGFSPANPRSKEFAKMLTNGIDELRKDGTLGKIINKYSLKEWNP